MNILPKKSWHVRNKDNIERVRRDEAKAAEEEKERQRKIALAESEARLDQLRESSRKRQRNDDTHYEEEGQIVKFVKPEHINFFKDEEAGLSKGQLGNKDHEKEKKEEKEKWEKKIGLLTYLGQGSVESQTSKPWYHKPREKTAKVEEDKKISKLNDEQDRKTKSSLDPMQQMSKYLTILEKQKERREEKEGHSKKHKKHKHKHKSKEREKEKSSGGGKTVGQLRAERLQREREEKARTEELLARRRGEKLPGDKQVITDERQRGYNSVFHPELSRKPKRKDYY